MKRPLDAAFFNGIATAGSALACAAGMPESPRPDWLPGHLLVNPERETCIDKFLA